MSDKIEEINGHEIRGDTYYKVLVDGKSCNGGEFEYELPEDGELGDWTPRIEKIDPCRSGYHLTNDPREWLDDGCDIYRAEGKGDGVECSDDKRVFHQVRLLEKVTFNTGKDNTGEFNSGNRNSGNRNSGNWNSGNRNSGNWNSGNWNSGERHTGFFNTGKPDTILVFNEPMDYEEAMNIDWPDWFQISPVQNNEECDVGSYEDQGYKDAWKESFEEASLEEVERATELPNFDYEVFEEITGITKQMIQDKIS